MSMRRAHTAVRTITGTYGVETEKAVFFLVSKVSGGLEFSPPKKEWFPFSQITRTIRANDNVGGDQLVVSEWILDKKGLLGREGDDLDTNSAPEGYNPPARTAPQKQQPNHNIKTHFDDYDDDIPF